MKKLIVLLITSLSLTSFILLSCSKSDDKQEDMIEISGTLKVNGTNYYIPSLNGKPLAYAEYKHPRHEEFGVVDIYLSTENKSAVYGKEYDYAELEFQYDSGPNVPKKGDDLSKLLCYIYFSDFSEKYISGHDYDEHDMNYKSGTLTVTDIKSNSNGASITLEFKNLKIVDAFSESPVEVLINGTITIPWQEYN